MSKDIVKSEAYAVMETSSESLRELVEANLQDRTLTPFDLNRATMPIGGATSWEVPTLEGTDSVKAIQGVLIYHKDTRAFWMSDEMDGSQPDCRSDDGVEGYGKREDDELEDYRKCKVCPKSQWGSATNGGKGQACTLKKALFILQPKTLLPLVVFIPPTSLSVMNRWLLNMVNYGELFYGVEIAIELEKISGNGVQYSRIDPKVVRKLEAEELAKVTAYRDMLIPSLRGLVSSDDDEE